MCKDFLCNKMLNLNIEYTPSVNRYFTLTSGFVWIFPLLLISPLLEQFYQPWCAASWLPELSSSPEQSWCWIWTSLDHQTWHHDPDCLLKTREILLWWWLMQFHVNPAHLAQCWSEPGWDQSPAALWPEPPGQHCMGRHTPHTWIQPAWPGDISSPEQAPLWTWSSS